MDAPLEEVEIPCRGCGLGQHRDASDECVYCDGGTYQDVDNHLLTEGHKIQECKVCPAGKYAPRIKELSDFQTWPSAIYRSCALATPIGNI